MSRRAVKRFEQALQSETPADPASSEEDETPINQSSAKATQGLFALLADDDDDDDDDDADDAVLNNKAADQDDGGNEDNTANKQPDPVPDPPAAPAPSSPKKRKKRRKPRKRRDAAENRENDPDWIALNEATNAASKRDDSPSRPPGYIPDSYFSRDDGNDVRDEARRILSSIEEMLASTLKLAEEEKPHKQRNVHQLADAGAAAQVLRVEPRFLNADSELKRLFGSRVVESERAEAAASAPPRRHGRSGGRGRRTVSLVTPRDTWFDHAPGLIMEVDRAANEEAEGEGQSVKYFRYAHESSYARVQDEYRMLVNMHDPNLLIGLLNQHPYHVDTLLQLAELYRQMGEVDTAADYVERCLYILEGSWNVSFKPFDGACRVSFDVLENRSLYVALFRYSQMLTRRGLHRTALEISKLLLNLDPERDPMGMLMLADSYALLSGEYGWVVEMSEKYKAIPLEYFPNFAVSRALATESMRLGAGGSGKRKGKGDAKSAAGNHGRDESGKVDDMLTDAILTFPMIVKPLLSAIQDNSSVWAESRLFDEPWYSAECEDGGVLIRMGRVYAERSKLLWNTPDHKELLLRCARRAGALDDAAGLGVNPATGKPSAAFVRDPTEHARVARCRALRVEAARFLGYSGLYDKVQIADFADSTTNLPAEILAGDDAQRAVGATPPREVSMAQGALEFLQSLLPWRDARDATQAPDGE